MTSDELFSVTPIDLPAVTQPEVTLQRSARYSFTRADDVAVAYPLNQEGWGGSNPTSALQLRFQRIGFDTARQLVALWHSRLPHLYAGAAGGGVYYYNYVAEFEGGWYAAAIWTSPIALNRMSVIDPREVIELRRLAICDIAPRNTASRMLAFMSRDLFRLEPGLRRLISYQDTAVHEGTIYRQLDGLAESPTGSRRGTRPGTIAAIEPFSRLHHRSDDGKRSGARHESYS